MDRTNMLAAHKVKLHGMTSSKWTTKDQITQYKGLISLYTKDQRVLEAEYDLSKRRQARQLKIVHRNIEADRKALNNLLKGDKQKLRNILVEHRELGLMFQDATPQMAIDKIHQENFGKRKLKDLLIYKLKTKSKILTELKLKCAEYEDRLKYAGITKLLPCEQRAYLLNGKVQDATLRIEAAVYIKNSYKDIISIMQKDAIYFNAILLTLEKDGLKQAECLLNLANLGQEAEEYLLNRKTEYKFFEKLVKQEMWDRRRDLEIVQQNVHDFAANLKAFIRDDKEINTGTVILEYSASCDVLTREIEGVEKTFKLLNDAFCNFSVDQLYPLLKEQYFQKERLGTFLEKCKTTKDDLLKKTDHASLVLSQLRNTTLETTDSYNNLKVVLKTKIEQEIDNKNKIQFDIDRRYKLLAKIGIGVKHLQYLTELLESEDKDEIRILYINRISSPPVKPKDQEVDPTKIVPLLLQTYSKLAEKSAGISDKDYMYKKFNSFEVLMQDRSRRISTDAVVIEEELIDTEFPDPAVPTAEDIKKQSEEIVALGLAALEYRPPSPRRKPYRYKFKK